MLFMRFPALLRRRTIWMPTFAGWALALLAVIAALAWIFLHLHAFLAVNQPVAARLLVVEGWVSPRELDQAIALFRNGHYRSVITTGGPGTADLYQPNPVAYARLARDYLIRHGVPADTVTAVAAPESAQDRTYLSAVMVRDWLQQSGLKVDALDVFSSGVHSRRSRALYRMAFGPKVRIGILAARPGTYNPDAWWTSSNGVKTVISESISWIWTELLFWPAAQGSHEEKWGSVSR